LTPFGLSRTILVVCGVTVCAFKRLENGDLWPTSENGARDESSELTRLGHLSAGISSVTNRFRQPAAWEHWGIAVSIPAASTLRETTMCGAQESNGSSLALECSGQNDMLF